MKGLVTVLRQIRNRLERIAVALEAMAYPQHIFTAKTLQCHCAPGEYCSNCKED